MRELGNFIYLSYFVVTFTLYHNHGDHFPYNFKRFLPAQFSGDKLDRDSWTAHFLSFNQGDHFPYNFKRFLPAQFSGDRLDRDSWTAHFLSFTDYLDAQDINTNNTDQLTDIV